MTLVAPRRGGAAHVKRLSLPEIASREAGLDAARAHAHARTRSRSVYCETPPRPAPDTVPIPLVALPLPQPQCVTPPVTLPRHAPPGQQDVLFAGQDTGPSGQDHHTSSSVEAPSHPAPTPQGDTPGQQDAPPTPPPGQDVAAWVSRAPAGNVIHPADITPRHHTPPPSPPLSPHPTPSHTQTPTPIPSPVPTAPAPATAPSLPPGHPDPPPSAPSPKAPSPSPGASVPQEEDTQAPPASSRSHARGRCSPAKHSCHTSRPRPHRPCHRSRRRPRLR
ncbi:vegetative cell wall protein gp1-like [Portunus trituberculatus]|uniref:vegetative cell wall protein gp1-like n=1 Tax=Portunus trituberculatus TaxID=210409 RepID=UPI001E1CE21F|nr:vegetative cell wall protein gp1-like [Portunus trituberculatus]XP_045119317.1 vegetative cell wall protein gp1-like [Portunus trituberculatus]XP_045119318.1 vegetative cell wall protein gp1-like [Portunus trituberculatus]